MDVKKIELETKEWYTAGRYFLPHLDPFLFARAIRSSIPILRNILPNKWKGLTIKVSNRIPTGAVNLDTNVIYISSAYFDPRFIEALAGETEAPETIAINLINRTLTHEALHVRYTRITPEKVIEEYGDADKWDKFRVQFGRAAVDLWQLIEDLYIENQTDAIGRANFFVKNGQQLMFNFQDGHEYSADTLDGLLELLCIAKGIHNRNDPRMSPTWKIISSALESHSLRRRVALTEKILDEYYVEPLEEEEPEEGEGDEGTDENEGEESEESNSSESSGDDVSDEGTPSEGTSSGDDSEDTDNEADETDETEDDTDGSESADEGDDELDEDAPSETESTEVGESTPSTEKPRTGESGASSETITEELREIIEALEEMSEEDLETLNEIIEQIVEEIQETYEDEHTHKKGYNVAQWNDLVERDVFDASGERLRRMEEGFDGSFIRDLQAIRNTRRAVGRPKNKGSKLVNSRLHRINVDSKVYAIKDRDQRAKNLEIILMLDASGSMGGGDLWNKVLGAAKEMSRAMRAARIPHLVVAHTSEDRDTPLLVRIFSYNMRWTDGDFDARFNEAQYIRLSQNYDGVVIDRVREMFTQKPADRFLIVLSDGTPAGPGYSGSAADEHTKMAVEETRTAGINVFSMSLISSVVGANDQIYGRGFNIDATGNVRGQLRTLINLLARG